MNHLLLKVILKIVFCAMPLDDDGTLTVRPVLPQDKKRLHRTVKVYFCCRLLAHVWLLGYFSKAPAQCD